jgi:3-phenylpropionate/trans-cinnamate dioxygenase ferredoxin subunit
VKVVVGLASEFPANSRRIVTVGGREIGVFRLGDRFYAVRNRCPHQGGPLALGRAVRRVVSEQPGKVRLCDEFHIVCPWHGWNYDLETGAAYAPGDPRVKSYSVSVEAGAEIAEQLEGETGAEPYVAETFEVSVEEEYVVLDA